MPRVAKKGAISKSNQIEADENYLNLKIIGFEL